MTRSWIASLQATECCSISQTLHLAFVLPLLRVRNLDLHFLIVDQISFKIISIFYYLIHFFPQTLIYATVLAVL